MRPERDEAGLLQRQRCGKDTFRDNCQTGKALRDGQDPVFAAPGEATEGRTRRKGDLKCAKREQYKRRERHGNKQHDHSVDECADR
ncbi:MAG: hypothetical protein U5O16_25530 [Rhodococcus sp. (in: high G+C Gram-positive bacteria)]|uniref:hypothetical protein n=1 Tax=Rhodococcus sp. TaxID=1831 RepID=UPI002ADCA161|nr:hypothetical protein [Rhodococcus sp. (in: high G+C Gram-positive bacteria)]